MKNLLLFIFCVFFSGAAFGQGTETFENATPTLPGSYSDGSFVGDNGVTWNYVESRNDGGYEINGEGLMLRHSTEPSSLSTTITGGIGNFSCKLLKAFTGAGNRQVELFVNGVSQGTSVAFDNTTVQMFDVNGINVSGSVTIEIRNITSKQVIIDDISWTGYTPNIPALIVSPALGNTNESGTSTTFEVSLSVSPSSNVEVNVLSSNMNENIITTSVPLTFTPLNYNMVQTVTVTGVDDALVDGNQTTTLTVSVVDANSADEYDGLSEMLNIINEDDEVIPVVITEIMYNTPSTDDEWIEIHNFDPSNNIDISNWTIEYNGSTVFTFPASTTIMSGSFLTIALGSNGDGSYNNDMPFIPDFNSLGVSNANVSNENNTNNLGNGAGTIILKNSAGIEVDNVAYDDGDVSSTDGNGSSYEIINWIMSNSTTASNWQASPSNGGSPGSAGSSVPVELLTFTATLNQKSIDLAWSTATEENNAYFEVQRSTDGNEFEVIGNIDGAGTTYETQEYSFTDENPTNGVNYYRLRQVDFDGQFEYHKVVSVLLNDINTDVQIYPNPTSGELNVVLSTIDATQVQIIDLTGKILRSFNASQEGINTFDVSDLADGQYMIRIKNNQTISTTLFVKTK